MDRFVIVYLDDILIFSDNLEEHIQHVNTVLARLEEHSLCAKISKCKFYPTSIPYLGFVIDGDGIRMDSSKIDSIVNWPTLTSTVEVQSFLGLVNFYRRFISNMSTLAHPLHQLSVKEKDFLWDDTCEAAFKKLKASIAESVVLKHPDRSLPFFLTTDVSNHCTGAVLSQFDSKGDLRPVAFLFQVFVVC